MKKLLDILFDQVKYICKKYSIDESHAVGHSMKVLKFSNDIYRSELQNKPFLEEQQKIIYTSAIIHDICDTKYMTEETGNIILNNLYTILETEKLLNTKEIKIINTIVNTMSYSKVKVEGYPVLDKYQMAFHIVREADLLAAYEYERCIIFTMYTNDKKYTESVSRAKKLFDVRVLKYIEDDLFVTEYSKKLASKLHQETLEYINSIDKILN